MQVEEVFETMRDEGKVGYLMTFPYTAPVAKAAIETDRPAEPIVAGAVVGLNTPARADGILDAVGGDFPPRDLVERACALRREEMHQE